MNATFLFPYPAQNPHKLNNTLVGHSKWPENTRQTPSWLFIPQLHLTVWIVVQAPEADSVKVVQKRPYFPSLLIKKRLAEQGIPARLRKTVQGHGTGTQPHNQEGLFLQCCRKHTHTSQRQWDENSFLDLCFVANKELHRWPNHKTWQEMSGVLPNHRDSILAWAHS